MTTAESDTKPPRPENKNDVELFRHTHYCRLTFQKAMEEMMKFYCKKAT